jgi:hypothetical protein
MERIQFDVLQVEAFGEFFSSVDLPELVTPTTTTRL